MFKNGLQIIKVLWCLCNTCINTSTCLFYWIWMHKHVSKVWPKSVYLHVKIATLVSRVLLWACLGQKKRILPEEIKWLQQTLNRELKEGQEECTQRRAKKEPASAAWDNANLLSQHVYLISPSANEVHWMHWPQEHCFLVRKYWRGPKDCTFANCTFLSTS